MQYTLKRPSVGVTVGDVSLRYCMGGGKGETKRKRKKN